MNNPMIVWCVIAGVLLCAFLFRAVERFYTECHNRDHKLRHLFEIGMEREIFLGFLFQQKKQERWRIQNFMRYQQY